MGALGPEDAAQVFATPLFGGIDPSTVLALIEGAILRDVTEGGPLFARGDPADRFFVVLAGQVHLYALTEAGDQSIIEVVEAGESFAEAAIFASRVFPLHGEAAVGTRLVEIMAKPFLQRLAERPRLGAKLLGALSLRQRRLLAEIAELKGRSPVQRLGLFLLALAQQGAAPATAVRLPLTKAQLASRLGIAPESLSRALARLKAVGVTSRGLDILIEDLAALRAFCGGD